jgi:hypothetical protein
MGKSVIQKHKRLIKKLNDLRTEDMFISIDLEDAVNSRKNLIRNYSIICNEIYSGSRAEDKKLKKELKKMIENKKLRISELLKDKIESKKGLRKIHEQLSKLL